MPATATARYQPTCAPAAFNRGHLRCRLSRAPEQYDKQRFAEQNVSHRAVRPGQKAKATVLASAAPSSSGVNAQICQSARFARHQTVWRDIHKGNATATMATQANSSRTRLWHFIGTALSRYFTSPCCFRKSAATFGIQPLNGNAGIQLLQRFRIQFSNTGLSHSAISG